jgi:hypothetical protein
MNSSALSFCTWNSVLELPALLILYLEHFVQMDQMQFLDKWSLVVLIQACKNKGLLQTFQTKLSNNPTKFDSYCQGQYTQS